MNIAELLTTPKNETTKSVAAPDPAVDPGGALAHHRSLWPLNQKVVDDKLPEAPEGSDRVRLRRMAETLAESGISVSGGFAASYNPSAQVMIEAYFGGSGNLQTSSPRIYINESGPMEDREMLEILQQTLQQWGFGAVATMNNTLTICEVGSEESAKWAESGLRPGYMSPGSKPTPAKMLQYNAVLGSKIGAGSIYGLVGWATSPFSPEQSLEWIESGVRSSNEATSWQAMGLDPAKAKTWIDARVDVHQAKHWLGAGYTPAKAKPWNDLCRNYEQSKAWIDGGYDLATAEAWVRFCGHSRHGVVPADVQPLLDAKISAKQLERLREAGCDGRTVEPLVKWVSRYKIELSEALLWAELGPEFVGPGKRGRWHKAGFQPDDIRKWQKALGTRRISVDEVKNKMLAGFDPEAGADWIDINSRFSDASLIAGWTEAGMRPKDAKPWTDLNAMLCDYRRVKEWQDAGLGPKDAKPWIAALDTFAYYPRVEAWQKADARLASNPSAAAELARVTSPENLTRTLKILDGIS